MMLATRSAGWLEEVISGGNAMRRHLLIACLAALALGCNESKPAMSLHEAAGTGNLAQVKANLEHGSPVDTLCDRAGYTPLHYAAIEGHIEIARLLLEHDADVNARARRTEFTPLHFAAMRGRSEVVRLLLDHGADPEAKSKNGMTPRYYAEKERQAAALALLDERPRKE